MVVRPGQQRRLGVVGGRWLLDGRLRRGVMLPAGPWAEGAHRRARRSQSYCSKQLGAIAGFPQVAQGAHFATQCRPRPACLLGGASCRAKHMMSKPCIDRRSPTTPDWPTDVPALWAPRPRGQQEAACYTKPPAIIALGLRLRRRARCRGIGRSGVVELALPPSATAGVTGPAGNARPRGTRLRSPASISWGRGRGRIHWALVGHND